MVASKKTEKWYKKNLCTRVPVTVRDLFEVFRPILLLAILTVCFDWIVLGVRPLRNDQLIFFVAATTASIISVIPGYLGSKFIRISSEILVFLLSETAVFATTIMNGVWIWNFLATYNDDIHLGGAFAALGYWLFSFSAVNTIIHLILIYHLVRGTGQKVIQYSVGVKAVFWVPGFILIYALVPFICSLPKEIDIAAVLLVNTQIIIALFPVTSTARELKFGKEAKILKKWFDLPTYYHYIVALTLLPVLISTGLIATKYGIASFFGELKHMIEFDIAAIMDARKEQEENRWFAASSDVSGHFLETIRSSTVIVCGTVYSFTRYTYLNDQIYVERKLRPKPSLAASSPKAEI